MKLSFDQFSAVIAEVESRNNPRAWGDAGRACGQWQEHPAFVAQWFPSSRWTLGMTWDDVFRNALREFYNAAVMDGVSDEEAAQGFHMHGQPRDPGDSPQYAERFREVVRRMK